MLLKMLSLPHTTSLPHHLSETSYLSFKTRLRCHLLISRLPKVGLCSVFCSTCPSLSRDSKACEGVIFEPCCIVKWGTYWWTDKRASEWFEEWMRHTCQSWQMAGWGTDESVVTGSYPCLFKNTPLASLVSSAFSGVTATLEDSRTDSLPSSSLQSGQ